MRILKNVISVIILLSSVANAEVLQATMDNYVEVIQVDREIELFNDRYSFWYKDGMCYITTTIKIDGKWVTKTSKGEPCEEKTWSK